MSLMIDMCANEILHSSLSVCPHAVVCRDTARCSMQLPVPGAAFVSRSPICNGEATVGCRCSYISSTLDREIDAVFLFRPMFAVTD